MTETRDYIYEELGEEELLCQLAEECAELTQAALKLRRVMNGKNPTPKKPEDALASMIEEIADVRLCIDMMCMTPLEEAQVDITIDQKMERWANRIREAREKARNG